MNAREQAQWKWDHVAKPLHSLGLLEDMIVKIAGIHETADVRIANDARWSSVRITAWWRRAFHSQTAK